MSNFVKITIAAMVLMLGAGTGQTQDMLRVGVRTDTKPFAYRAGPDAPFEGFVFELCSYALRALGYNEGKQFRFLPANADNRLKALTAQAENGTTIPRQFDMVCDPTSLTINRAGRFFFSPVVFISGGSFLVSEPAADAFYAAALTSLNERQSHGQIITGYGGEAFNPGPKFENVSKVSAIEQPEIEDCTAATPSQIVGARLGHVRETTGEELIRKALAADPPAVSVGNFQIMCSQGFKSHQDAVEALCNNEISHHFGDRDIISNALSAYKATPAGQACRAELDPSVYSSEPYVIVISPELEKQQILALQRGVLLALSSAVQSAQDPSASRVRLPHHLFRKHFSGQKMSTALRDLYWQY